MFFIGCLRCLASQLKTKAAIMAKPRKFSEKIALHNQKQAEETAAFEKIMREVSDATSKVNALPKKHLLLNPSLGSYRGGSLPNVNHIGSNSVDLKSALVNLEEMKTRGESPLMYRCERSSRGIGPVRSRTSEKRIDTSPYSSGTYLSPPLDSNWRRTNSDSALHQSAMNMGSETSLHSPGSQRREAISTRKHLKQHTCVIKVTDGQLLGIGISDPCDPTRKHSPDGRPRSSCSERVPGINIFPSQPEPGTVQIPIGNNTGSLPDLTSFHFPPPLPTPLDQEDPSSSPYSTSPQAASPSTLSPTSISSRPMGRFSFSSPQDSQGPSPGHSPDMRRRHYPTHTHHLLVGGPPSPTQLQAANHLSVPSLMNSRYLHTCKGLTLDNSGSVQMEDFTQNQFVYQTATQAAQTQMQQQQQHHHSQQVQQPPSPQQQQQQQHVQNHQSPTQSLQHSPPLPAASPSQQQQSQSSPQSQHQQHQQQQQQAQQQQQQSQSLISNSQNMSAQHLSSLSTYRSQQTLSRPSPQTSPGLIMQGSPLVYRSGSPGDTTHSGPQSPVSPASSPGIGPTSSPFSEHNFYNSTSLQQHFEQFSMMDNPVPTSIGYSNSQINTGHSLQAVSHSPEDGLTQVGTQELLTDPGYYSQSPSTQLQYNRPVSINPSGGSTQQTTPQTPNTPSSIPDIILTDFSSSTGDDLSRQEFVKDLGTAMSGSFDTDLFPSDETLREGLDPIDFDGLQMLTDPDMNVITDPATEDNFRLDKLK